MSLIDSLLEDGHATDTTLSRLVAIFGSPQAGQVVHEIIQAVLEAQQAAQPADAAQVSEADAHSAQAGAQ